MKLTTWARILGECIDALEEEYVGEEMLLATICASSITDTLKQRKACDEYSRADLEFVLTCLRRFYSLETFGKVAIDMELDMVQTIFFNGNKIKDIKWVRWNQTWGFLNYLKKIGGELK